MVSFARDFIPNFPFWFCPHLRSVVQVTAAHICYLVAEANLEPYSDSARLCLVGADHWKFPRTYASPEAIQVFCTILFFHFT